MGHRSVNTVRMERNVQNKNNKNDYVVGQLHFVLHCVVDDVQIRGVDQGQFL